MNFWNKPNKIETIKYKPDDFEIKLPDKLLDDNEYMIFHTKKIYAMPNIRGLVFWYLLTSKGKILTCEYKTKKFEIIDDINIFKPGGNGIKYKHKIEPAFICDGWLNIISNLDKNDKLSPPLIINNYGCFDIEPLIILLKTYTSSFPETIITSDNNDPDKFFEYKSGKKIKEILSEMSDLLEDSPREKNDDYDNFIKARKDLKKIISKSRKKSKRSSKKKSKKRKRSSKKKNKSHKKK